MFLDPRMYNIIHFEDSFFVCNMSKIMVKPDTAFAVP